MTEASEKHFVVDGMLGKLAKWLRILGFDTRCERLDTREQVEIYQKQGLLLITRNRRWSGQPRMFCLTANNPAEQLREVVSLAAVRPQEVRLLERCVRCNQRLLKTASEDAFGRVPDYVFETHPSFHRCPNCERIYWRGSHPKRMVQRLEQTLGWTILSDSAGS